jgi:DNA-directed RNA polymerase I, II, and III subunit RPABC1
LELSLEEFKANYVKGGIIDRPSLTFLVEHRSDESNQLLVFFSDDDSIGIKPIRKQEFFFYI